jgi:hypothetical protein
VSNPKNAHSLPWRSRPMPRRIAIAALAVLVVTYLTLITISFRDRLASSQGRVTLGVLWLCGLVALTLLYRAWQHVRLGDGQGHGASQ